MAKSTSPLLPLTALVAMLCLAGVHSASLHVHKMAEGQLPPVMFFPDENGRMWPAIMNVREIVQPRINEKDDVLFYIFRREKTTQVFVDDVDALKSSGFDPKAKTFIVTHGFLSSDSSDTVQQIKDMYLGAMDCNVVGVDWSSLAHNIIYPEAKKSTVPVGQYVAKFIDFVARELGLNTGDLELIGHSLGAHVMGIAGKNVQSGKIARITGMDPAGPLYSLSDTSDRLAVGDADFVQAIHTCAGIYGFNGAIADADFFPNGGTSLQPGCNVILGSVCSHSRSWIYFAESITSNKFLAVPCDSYENFLNGSCNDGEKVPMGEPTPTSTRGTYYLNTASEPPFALG
ncbi:phospholipase A1-like [Ischnura elegans]|uniref:phospholipase A1-like n=1 Tax=Ischnura elegans TaxID=197161 RepID=UPI001ED8740C|nr:phospholipase A1-like [Ischnura elegans]